MENNNAVIKIVDDMISQLDVKIKRLTELDSKKNEHEIKFLEYLQNNFIRLADYRDQILNLIPYYQNEIASNWDNVTDSKFEFEKKKQQVETLKQQVNSIQTEEVELQKQKRKLSRELNKKESNLIRDQKRFNKKGNELDELHARLNILSVFETDSNDTFINKFFESRNKLQAKRLTRLMIDRKFETDNLSEQIQNKQDLINEASEDIEFHQNRLKELQIQNINLRKQVEEVLNSIKENGVEIKQTENRIEEQNEALQQLSLSLVKIANETSRQHSIYKKASLAPLDELDYEKLLDESIPSTDFQQNLDDFLSLQSLSPVSEQLDM